MPRYGKGYEHIDDAAAAALMHLEHQPRVRDQEYMGLLVRDPETGLIYRTDFQTQGRRDSSEWTGYPEGKAAGIVHSHPSPKGGPSERYPGTHLSRVDVDNANAMKVPSYITAMPRDNNLSQQRKHAPRGAKQPVPGDEFLAQFPIEEFLQYLAARRARENPIAAAMLGEKPSPNATAAVQQRK